MRLAAARIDDELVADTLRATGLKTKREAAELGLRTLLRLRRQGDSLDVVDVSDREIAIPAARNFRRLRELGVTVRKTVDTLIATRCIEDGFALLYSDRGFDPFVHHLGLTSALSQA